MKKGMTNNPNGRPKGSENKITASVREMISDFISGKLETVMAEFDQLETKEKFEVLSKLLPYVAPRLQSVENEVTLQHPTIIWKEERTYEVERLAGD